ncbi:hypothetical protein F5Y05DRAFT_347288 [Hypoxylon sp. FL0543]|nr:hypothetical protein F5Y05DRAFT_347288 [Hypoxylon sp. FL0543]
MTILVMVVSCGTYILTRAPDVLYVPTCRHCRKSCRSRVHQCYQMDDRKSIMPGSKRSQVEPNQNSDSSTRVLIGKWESGALLICSLLT